METALKLNIISAEKTVFSDTVSAVVVPGISGKFGILPGHAPLISSLQKGDIVYQKEEKEYKIAVDGGVIEVNNNVLTICVI